MRSEDIKVESTKLNGGDAFEIAAAPGDETRVARGEFGNGGGNEISMESKSMESLDCGNCVVGGGGWWSSYFVDKPGRMWFGGRDEREGVVADDLPLGGGCRSRGSIKKKKKKEPFLISSSTLNPKN